jgi:hypothetical protein
MSANEEWVPLLAFDSDEPEFVRGFEVGRLWAQMVAGEPAPVTATIHASNAEMVMRMAEALGYRFTASDLDPKFVSIELVQS